MKIFFKLLVSLLGLSVFCSGLFYLFRSSSNNKRPLIVGMMSGWAPFMVVNDQGAYEGFDVDVARELANRLRRDVEIRDIGSLASLLLALEQGAIDIALSGLDITESRRQVLCMIPYTGTAVTSFCLLFQNQIPVGVTSLSDLQRLSLPVICVEPGSSLEKFLDQFPWIVQKSLSKTDEMVLDVEYGKSLAMLVEPLVATRLVRQRPNLKRLDVQIGRDFQTFGMGITLAPNRKDLIQQITTIAQDMRNDGTLMRFEKKWKLIEEKK